MSSTNRKKDFSIVYNEIIRDRNTNAYDVAVYSVLCHYANNETKKCFPSQNTIAKDINAARNTVRKSIERLEEFGYISIEKREHNNEKTSHIYTLLNVDRCSTDEQGCSTDEQGVVHDMNSNYTNANYTKRTNLSNKLDKGQAHDVQETMKSIQQKKKDAEKEKKRKKRTHAEIASDKITSAKKGAISWAKVSYRDFTYYYIQQHNKVLQTVTFDRYSSVSIIRDDFIKRFDIPLEKVCDYIDAVLHNYQDHPSFNDYPKLTFYMIQKNNRLIKELIEMSERTLKPVERKYSTNTFTNTEKAHSTPQNRSYDVF